ncbi:MAG: hypothetical protein AABZ33_05815 [Chloroflexota bacterium]
MSLNQKYGRPRPPDELEALPSSETDPQVARLEQGSAAAGSGRA